MRPEGTPGRRPPGRWLSWGTRGHATVPTELGRGYGPRRRGERRHGGGAPPRQARRPALAVGAGAPRGGRLAEAPASVPSDGCAAHGRLDGYPGAGGLSGLTRLGRATAEQLGPSAPYGPRAGRAWGGGLGALGMSGTPRAATAVPLGHRTANGGTEVGLGGPRASSPASTHGPGGQSRGMGTVFAAGRRGAGGVARRPRRGSDASHRGARPPLRSIVEQATPGNGERQGQVLGGTRAVVASHLSPPGSTNVSYLRRSGVMSMHKRGARSELAHPACACADAFYPVINYEKG
jgi:hypothetical protein